MPRQIHQETFRVRFFEADALGRITPGALCRYAQEAADGHCHLIGMSLDELREQTKMWILTRFRLCVETYPKRGDILTVQTWASSRTDGLRACRDFAFYNAEGRIFARAFSIWLMMDVARKRPVRLPTVITDIINPDLSDTTAFEVPRLKSLEAPTRIREFQVGWGDLDVNNHVNNVRYVEWALEALPLEVQRDSKLVQLDVEFLMEAFYADSIQSAIQWTGDAYSHMLKSSSGKTVAILKSVWHI